jgi:sterol desaturase/sphingolipid hydroxylase (fatty acid hydroxylase superfamily)
LNQRLAIFLSLLALGFVAERLWPLRARTQPVLRRWLINLSYGILGWAVLRLFFVAALLSLSREVVQRGVGLLPFLGLSRPAALLAGLLLLDYTLFLWHRANHRIPFLWRFHQVHHADLDMDISTAARFHFGELALSALYRALQILAFGIDPELLLFFEVLITSSAQFHHSNLRLASGIDRALTLVTVSPRMHGIHHSRIREETDSNFSTILSVWDRLHRSLRLDIPQQFITIGVPYVSRPEDIGWLRGLGMPFRALKPWRSPDGSVPTRSPELL